jgi:hypothetical protein
MSVARILSMMKSNAKSGNKMSFELPGSTNWTPIHRSKVGSGGIIFIASLMIIGFVFGCATAPGADDAVENHRDRAVEVGVEEESEDGAETENFEFERLPYWGVVQLRADEAHQAMVDEIDSCLRRLGPDQAVRSITVKARRDLSDGPAYEIAYLTSSPSAPEDEPCVEEISNEFIEALGPGYFDDFDVYMATFIHRGAAGGECDDQETYDNVRCVDLAGIDDVDGPVADDSEACPEELVEATQRAVSEARFCRDVDGFHDRMSEYEDRGHELRAVVFGDVRVEDGQARVVFRYNQPWVESFAHCMSEHLDEIDMSEFDVDRPCRSNLRNRSIVLWHRPWFVYLFE